VKTAIQYSLGYRPTLTKQKYITRNRSVSLFLHCLILSSCKAWYILQQFFLYNVRPHNVLCRIG